VLRQQEQGYQLSFLESDGEICAVAGYRFLESLFSSKNLYVDDLVTRDRDRSRGFGGELSTGHQTSARARLRKFSSSIRACEGSMPSFLFLQANEHFFLSFSD